MSSWDQGPVAPLAPPRQSPTYASQALHASTSQQQMNPPRSTTQSGHSTAQRGQSTAQRGQSTAQRGQSTAQHGQSTAQRGQSTAQPSWQSSSGGGGSGGALGGASWGVSGGANAVSDPFAAMPAPTAQPSTVRANYEGGSNLLLPNARLNGLSQGEHCQTEGSLPASMSS